METLPREEVWFARVVVILGARELMDVAINLAAVLKYKSGLPIVGTGSDATIATAYLIESLIAGIYLTAGGSVLSKIAYNRSVPRAALLAPTYLPEGTGWLSVALRGFGAYEIIRALSAIVLAVTFYEPTLKADMVHAPRYSVIQTATAIEHTVIGFALLAVGGAIAKFFLGGRRATAASSTGEARPPGN